MDDNPFADMLTRDEDFTDEALDERFPEPEAEEETEEDDIDGDGDADAVDDADSGDLDSDSDPHVDTDGGETSDEEDEADEGDEDEEPEEELSYTFKSQKAAEEAYKEAQSRMNQEIEERRKIQERLAALEQGNQGPEYDQREFAEQQAQSPQDAFNYAVENGRFEDAQSVIAQVQADAQEQAAIAAAARHAGDAEAYQEAQQWVHRINGVAEEMRSRMFATQQQRAQQPVIERQQREDLSAAWNVVRQETEQQADAKREEIKQVLSQRPYLLTDNQGQVTRESALEGYRAAYKLVSDAPDVDALVQQKVKEELMKARKKNASSAGGEAGKSRGKSDARAKKSDDDETRDGILESIKQKSIGANKFMDL